MASSLTKQQMKLSKSIISFSAYRATRTWFSLLFNLKPTQDDNKIKVLHFSVDVYTLHDYGNECSTAFIPAASTARRISYELMAPDLSMSNSLKVTCETEADVSTEIQHPFQV